MDLTSLRRVKYSLGITKTDQDHILSRLVGSASKQIVYWLRRLDNTGTEAIKLQSRTEYIDPIAGQRVFYPRAYPVSSITSIYGDTTGLYTGSEVALTSTQYLIGADGRSIILTADPSIPQWTTLVPVVPRGDNGQNVENREWVIVPGHADVRQEGVDDVFHREHVHDVLSLGIFNRLGLLDKGYRCHFYSVRGWLVRIG